MTSGASAGLGAAAERPFWRGTVVVHWFLVVHLLVLVTSLPAVVGVPLLAADASNLPLLALLLVPVGPAVAAAVFAWQKFTEDRDSGPARQFLRGYRLNWRDALAVWVPALALLTVLGVNLANLGAVAGGAVIGPVSVAIGALVVLVTAHALVIASLFSFRLSDVLRLAAYHVGAAWRTTLNAAALAIVVAGSVVLVSEWLLVLVAGPLTYFLHAGAAPMIRSVRTRFTG